MDEPNKNSRTVVIALVLLVFFVVILVLFLILIKHPAIFGSFAQSETTVSTSGETLSSQNISYDNSYVFASPLKASINGEKIRITAYVLDGQGMGVGGKLVILGNNDTNLKIDAVSQTTDVTGRATFDVSSGKSGTYTIDASVDGKRITQKVTVAFN